MCHMQTPSSGGGYGDHREGAKPCQALLPLLVFVVVGGASGVLIKTLIVVPPNKADAAEAGGDSRWQGEEREEVTRGGNSGNGWMEGTGARKQAASRPASELDSRLAKQNREPSIKDVCNGGRGILPISLTDINEA